MQEIDLVASLLNVVSKSNGSGYNNDVNERTSEIKKLLSGPNSISRRSKMQIFEYPVFVSEYITNYDIVASILKTLEVEYSRMLLLLFGINPNVDFNQNYRIQRTLSTYHSNDNAYKFNMESAIFSEESLQHTFSQLNKMGFTEEGKHDIPIPPQKHNFPNGKKRDFTNPPKGNQDTDNNRNPKFIKAINTNTDKNNSVKTKFDEIQIMSKYASKYNFTVLEVSLFAGGKAEREIKIPIGIRAAPHIFPVNQLEYIINSFLRPQTTNMLINYYRWRSGEIGFIEMVTRYSEMKRDIEFDKSVNATGGPGAAWLKSLKQQANRFKLNKVASLFAKIMGRSFNANDVPPKATYLLTFANVDEIEKETGINLFTNPAAASKFLDDSMGLCLIILDEPSKIVHIMYSAYNKYVSHALDSVMSKSLKEKDMTKILIDMMKNTM